jgi:hypothetical protein
MSEFFVPPSSRLNRGQAEFRTLILSCLPTRILGGECGDSRRTKHPVGFRRLLVKPSLEIWRSFVSIRAPKTKRRLFAVSLALQVLKGKGI